MLPKIINNMFFLFLSIYLISLASISFASGIDIDEMISKMTIEEKIGQMTQIDILMFMKPGTDEIDFNLLSEWFEKYKIGSILNSPFSGGNINDKTGWTALEWRENIIKIQNMALSSQNQTLGIQIPIIYGIDSIHGATFIKDSALFPQSIGLSATFNTSLSFEIGRITAKDTRAAGIPWIFAPVLGLGLQPLWARFPETFGEDPHLAAQMGSANIKGLQFFENDGGIPKLAAACMKHFIAYSKPEGGHDRSPVQLPDRLLKQLYLPSFQAAIDANVMTAMESYQEVGGVPMVSSSEYLNTLLRKQMGFQGMLVTDYSEIENLHNWHRAVDSIKNAIKVSIEETSIDMSMVAQDSTFNQYLNELVDSGDISEERVDESVRKILQLKQDLGLMETPVPPVYDPLLKTVGQDADWQLAVDASRESITLLKNDNGLLPILPQSNLFVTGPAASSLTAQSGGWSIHWQGGFDNSDLGKGITILQGLQDKNIFSGKIEHMQGPGFYDSDLSNVDLDSAKSMALSSDAVVVCVGEDTYAEKPGDINDLALPKAQLEYIQFLSSVTLEKSIPIILVIVSGRPRLLGNSVAAATAILNTYVPGPMGGQAVAEILSGKVVPSGRLPFSYPKDQANILYPYHRKPSDQCTKATGPHTTEYIPCQVEWNFGTGLSYTKFEYSDFQISTTNLNEFEQIDVSVVVSNTGELEAKHTVMLFLFDSYRRVTPEYKLLKRFEKVHLKAGESKALQWTLNREDLKYIGINGRYVLESGEFFVGMGPDVDCRSSDPSNWVSDESKDGKPLCLNFQLNLSNGYNAICETACNDYWSSKQGICGTSIDQKQCTDVCLKQKWTWNYVDCIEQYYGGASCCLNFFSVI